MKQTIITTLLALVALTVQAQGPLLKTHVETGDLKRIRVIDGFMKYVLNQCPKQLNETKSRLV